MVKKYKSTCGQVAKKKKKPRPITSTKRTTARCTKDRKQLRQAAVPPLKHGSCPHFCTQDKQGHVCWTLAPFPTSRHVSLKHLNPQ